MASHVSPALIKQSAQTGLRKLSLKRKTSKGAYSQLQVLNFHAINALAREFAQNIENNYESVVKILLQYESYEVVKDEINRTLDLLRSLPENKQYFRFRIGEVTTFLPRNQPLYALSCFVIIPSLMASKVFFRVPSSMKTFLPQLLRCLSVKDFFPNINISEKERSIFLKDRSSLRINSLTQESWPTTEVVIFTGTPNHAERLRLVFDKRTLFISNGSGHNPVVVSQDADLSKAVEAVLSLQFYNQGQDCAAPNSILVHEKIFSKFHEMLLAKVLKLKIGPYEEVQNRIGPISDPEDLVRIQGILIDSRKWLDSSTPGRVRTVEAIVEPCLVVKPLKEGGNFSEVFAPIIFLQKYDGDEDLSLYFESSHYARNAMYVSLYGTSKYVDKLSKREIDGKVLHDESTILRNKHLHEIGVERGTQPYGGFGYGASSLSHNDKIVCKPTLPQRDIYQVLVKPLLNSKARRRYAEIMRRTKKVVYKDVQKLLGMKISEIVVSDQKRISEITYLDSHKISGEGKRYVCAQPESMYHLLNKRNLEYASRMEPKDIVRVHMLRDFLKKHKAVSLENFSSWLYALPKKKGETDGKNRTLQLAFFSHIYHLLLGKDSGPRLAHFLLDADRKAVCELLDI